MKCFLFPAALLLTQTLIAQKIKPLQIGDIFPDLYLKGVLGNKTGIHMRDFKGKKIVIEFWNTHCLSCIRGMPVLEELQERYKGKLQVLLVTSEPRHVIDSVFKKRKWKKPSLPMVVGDNLLRQYFPYEGVPHVIWVNANGRVEQIAASEASKEKSIIAFLNDEPVSFTEKTVLEDFDRTAPIWQEGNGRLSHHIKFYSCVSGFIPEYSNPVRRYGVDSTGRYLIKQMNVPLLDLYRYAYCGGVLMNDLSSISRMIFEVADRRPFMHADEFGMDKWRKECFVSYELRTPSLPDNEFYKIMQQDLDRYFPYSVAIEKRKVPVLILRCQKPLPGFDFPRKRADVDENSWVINFKGVSSTELAFTIKNFLNDKGKIIIDSSDNRRIDSLTLPYPIKDLASLQEILSANGWILEEAIIELDMLVFRDKERTVSY